MHLRRHLPLLAAVLFWLLSVVAVPAFASIEAGPSAQEAVEGEVGRIAPTLVPKGASFGGVTATTSEEAALLNNAAATFKEGSVYSSATRFEGNIVIQRSDIPWSVQNVRRAAGGNTPFVRNSLGEWERVNLHHVGRQEGQVIEVLQSQNAYNPATGGPLHIPGPGGPARSSTSGYWQQRLRDAIDAGLVDPAVLRQAGL